MKVLIIRNYPSYMSVKNNTYNIQEVGLAKALIRNGHKCDVLFWTNGTEQDVEIEVNDKDKLMIFYRRGITSFKNTIFINCHELFEKYDILQPCEYNQIQAWILAKNYAHKVVIYHGPYYSKYNKKYNIACAIFDLFFLRRYKKYNTTFITKSEKAKEFLEKKGIKEKNISSVGVGVDLQMLLTNQQCKELVYLNMKKNKSALKILYVGKLEERRDVTFILKVFSKVKERYNNSFLYIIGNGEEKYTNEIKKVIDDLDLSKNIFWQEKCEQKYLSDVYKLADFFVLPTEYEIFGMVLLEAMLYGTVVLTTSNGGSCTLIQNKKNGFIFNQKDANEWANTICELWSNKEVMKKVQDLATSTIEAGYTWDKIVPLVLNVYNEKIKMCR